MYGWIKLSLLVLGISMIAPNNPIKTSVAFGVLGYLITVTIVPKVGNLFKRIGLKGKDLSKSGPSIEIPESMGVVSAITYMFMMYGLIPFVFFKYLVSYSNLSNEAYQSENYLEQYNSIDNTTLFPHNKLAQYLSAIICLQGTVLLGLFDDLFDIRWRHKFFLPAVASLPLLIVYYVDFSVTSIVIPTTLIKYVPNADKILDLSNIFIKKGNHIITYITGLSFSTLNTDYEVPDSSPKLLDLGVFYYAYMSAISIFCPNSINILAGINGLEVGQSVVLAIIFLINDFFYLWSTDVTHAAYDSHLFSVIFILPFLGVSIGLLQFNWYPAKVFVGDTYCYFSGMVFAIVGILGHFSKTLLLFFLPQILNFIYSVPQLFHIVPCPRHRLPKFNAENGLMYPSYGELNTQPSSLVIIMLSILSTFKLIDLKRDDKGNIIKFSNLTIINLNLVWFGPLRENSLCILILCQQLVLGVSMVLVRHTVGPWLFGYDNLNWRIS